LLPAAVLYKFGANLNWLFYLQACFSGVLAAFFAWMLTPDGNPWNLLENFQISLLANGIFTGFFIGFVSALPVLQNEKRVVKAVGYWISATSVGLALNMLAAVIFTIIGEVLVEHMLVSRSLLRFVWWAFLAVGMSLSFGILHHSFKIVCRSLMGLTPAFIFAGTLLDRFFIVKEQWFLSFLFVGLVCGSCFAIVWDLLKETWLDEDSNNLFVRRYYIDSPEFIFGGLNECDLSIDGLSENAFSIIEKEGIHYLEVLDDTQLIKVNNCRFRYRTLIDGDVIKTGDRSFVYHSKLARTRDVLPEAVA
jgi:hypothetical protein